MINKYYDRIKDRFPIIFALISQTIALLIIVQLPDFFPSGHPLRFLIGQVGISFLFSQFLFKLPRWWGAIAIMFPLIVVVTFYLASISSWIYLMCFVVLSLVFTNTLFDRVPLYLTNHSTHLALIAICEKYRIKNVVDLGSGLGGVVRALSIGGRRSVGVESAPFSWLWSYLFSKLTSRGEIFRKNIWDFEVSDFDAIYVFLSPVPMERVYDKFKKETKSGSYLISNSFQVPEIIPFEVITLEDRRKTVIYIYKNK